MTHRAGFCPLGRTLPTLVLVTKMKKSLNSVDVVIINLSDDVLAVAIVGQLVVHVVRTQITAGHLHQPLGRLKDASVSMNGVTHFLRNKYLHLPKCKLNESGTYKKQLFCDHKKSRYSDKFFCLSLNFLIRNKTFNNI